MGRAIEKYRSEVFFGVEGLVEAANEVIRQFNGKLRGGKRLEYTNIRTVRYYITEGLLMAPSEKRGQSSLFRYRHLISLLVIKWFQSQGLSISVIQDAICHMTVDQLENAFGDRVLVFTDKTRLDSFVAAEGREEGEDLVVLGGLRNREDDLLERSHDVAKKNAAKGFLEGLLNKSREERSSVRPVDVQNTSPNYSSAGITPSVNTDDAHASEGSHGDDILWRRIVVTEGLELNIGNSFKAPRTEGERRALVERLEMVINEQ